MQSVKGCRLSALVTSMQCSRDAQCLHRRCREGVMWPPSARQDPFAEYHSLISLQQRLQAAISAAFAEVG